MTWCAAAVAAVTPGCSCGLHLPACVCPATADAVHVVVNHEAVVGKGAAHVQAATVVVYGDECFT